MARLVKKWFIYIFRRPNGIPCYVGLSCRKDRPAKHLRMAENHTNRIFANIIKKYGRKNLLFDIEASDLTKSEAIAIEIALIAKYGRRDLRKGPLANLTDGGEGTSGIIISEKWLARRAKFLKEFWNNPENRAAASNRMKGNSRKKGKPNSELWRERTSARMKGNTATLGLVHSEASLQKMRDNWANPVWRANILAKRQASGMYSKERCQARWEKRKENTQATA